MFCFVLCHKACGIRDFRGPNGVWTREKRGLGFDLLPGDVPFEEASPSLTHMAILALVRAGLCKHVVSQNVDGLHLRSGFPREMLSELHGNIFQERCQTCDRVYFRNFDVGGCGFKKTGRRCDLPCGGELFDMVLDWEDALPVDEFHSAQRHSLLADFSLALGTSMRVLPASGIPLLTVNKIKIPKRMKRVEAQDAQDNDDDANGDIDAFLFTEEEKTLVARNGSLAIINLQPTPNDQSARVRVHGKTDRIMRELMRRLEISIPDFVRMEEYRMRVTQEGSLSIWTDSFGQNCLFAENINVRVYRERDGQFLQEFEFQPRMAGQLHVPGVEKGEPLKVVAQIRLNKNATVSQVLIEATWGYESSSVEHSVLVEAVRKSFPLVGGDEDDNFFLHRDLPRSIEKPRKTRKRPLHKGDDDDDDEDSDAGRNDYDDFP